MKPNSQVVAVADPPEAVCLEVVHPEAVRRSATVTEDGTKSKAIRPSKRRKESGKVTPSRW